MGSKLERVQRRREGIRKHAATFFIAHVHGPFFVPTVVVDGRDDALRVAFCGVLLNGFQHALCSYKSATINSVLEQRQRTVLGK